MTLTKCSELLDLPVVKYLLEHIYDVDFGGSRDMRVCFNGSGQRVQTESCIIVFFHV